jgi:hypothetical protein
MLLRRLPLLHHVARLSVVLCHYHPPQTLDDAVMPLLLRSITTVGLAHSQGRPGRTPVPPIGRGKGFLHKYYL